MSRRVDIKCPECGYGTIEEVSAGVIYNEIGGFYDEYEEYDGNDFEETEVLRYQCMGCGKILAHGYQDSLYETCKEQGWLDIEEEKNPNPDWEV